MPQSSPLPRAPPSSTLSYRPVSPMRQWPPAEPRSRSHSRSRSRDPDRHKKDWCNRALQLILLVSVCVLIVLLLQWRRDDATFPPQVFDTRVPPMRVDPPVMCEPRPCLQLPCQPQPCETQPCEVQPCAKQPCEEKACVVQPCAKQACEVQPCAPQPCTASALSRRPSDDGLMLGSLGSEMSESDRLAAQASELTLQDVLPFASTPGDSSGTVIGMNRREGDLYKYELCTFTNVCAGSDGLSLFVQDRTEYDRLAELYRMCTTKEKYKAPGMMHSPCHCFYGTLAPRLLPFWDGTDGDVPSEESIQYAAANPDAPSVLRSTRTNPLEGNVKKGHYFAIHKWVRHHHIAHWAQKVVLMQSTFQHSHLFPRGTEGDSLTLTSWDPALPSNPESPGSPGWEESKKRGVRELPWKGGAFDPLGGVVLLDTDAPLSPHEAFLFNASLRSLLSNDPRSTVLKRYLEDGNGESGAEVPEGALTFAGELDKINKAYDAYHSKENSLLRALYTSSSADRPAALDALTSFAPSPPPLRCFERLTWNKAFGIVSSSSRDTVPFRAHAYAQVGLSEQLARRCPPRKVVLLYRENRGILNWQEVGEAVKEITGYDMVRETVNKDSTPEEQIKVFASAGILLSSHSSQLINVLFSHPSSAMIEVSAEYYNADFAEYAHGMGVFFQYALGGSVPDGKPDPGIQGCVDELSHCDGNSHCILVHRFHCPPRHANNKNLNFVANITAVRLAVAHAQAHLNWACDGQWGKIMYLKPPPGAVGP